MPDLMRLIVQLSGGALGYEDVLWIATSSVCLLLLLAGPSVFAGAPGPNPASGSVPRQGLAPQMVASRRTLVFLWVAMGLSLAIGLPDWLGVPQVNDYSTPWHVLFTFWLLASVPAVFVFFRVLRGERKRPLFVGLCAVMGLLLLWALIGATLRTDAHGVVAPAALLYAAPLLAGGVLLGWALASRQRRYALYVAAWLAGVATVGLTMYLLQMSTPMYNVNNYSAAQLYSPERERIAALVTGATQVQVWISVVYFVVSLAVLILPLLLYGAASRRRLRSIAGMRRGTPEQAFRAGGGSATPLDDTHQARGRA